MRVRGPKMDVFMALGYPALRNRDPILAAELVAFGKGTALAFMDLQSPFDGDPSWLGRATPAVEEWRGEGAGCSAPPWAIQHGFGLHLLRRPGGSHEDTWLFDALESYAAAWAHSLSAEPESGIAVDAAFETYRETITQNSPGAPFMKQAFGSAWVDELERDFLHRKETGA